MVPVPPGPRDLATCPGVPVPSGLRVRPHWSACPAEPPFNDWLAVGAPGTYGQMSRPGRDAWVVTLRLTLSSYAHFPTVIHRMSMSLRPLRVW